MTPEQYWAEVRRLGLRPTTAATPTVYMTASGDCHNVPNPETDGFGPEDRLKVINRLKAILGVGGR